MDLGPESQGLVWSKETGTRPESVTRPVRSLVTNIILGLWYMLQKNCTSSNLARLPATALVKISVIFGDHLKRQKVDLKKQTYMKTETWKLYSRDFWIFLPVMSTKLIVIISSYTVSMLVHFLRQSVVVAAEMRRTWRLFLYTMLNNTTISDFYVIFWPLVTSNRRRNFTEWN